MKKYPFAIIALFLPMLIALLLPILLMALYFWAINQTYTVAQGEKSNGLGTTYGYKLENYRFWNGMRMTIWEKVGLRLGYEMKSVYDLSSCTVFIVEQEQWIKSDGAIYLKLQITYHDSLESTEPTRIIYDFHTGQMYITSDLTLWRMWSTKLKPEGWMTEAEFDKVLLELKE